MTTYIFRTDRWIFRRKLSPVFYDNLLSGVRNIVISTAKNDIDYCMLMNINLDLETLKLLSLSNIDPEKIFSVTVSRPGPLYLRLKLHTCKKFIIVHGFDKDESGNPGEVEADGRVNRGDALISVDDVPTINLTSFRDVIEIIKKSSDQNNQNRRVLHFIKRQHLKATLLSQPNGMETMNAMQNMIADPLEPKIIDDEDDDIHSQDSPLLKNFAVSNPQLGPPITDGLRFTTLSNLIYNNSIIDEYVLREISSQGIPDFKSPYKRSLRPILWRLLLKYV